jgi:hypothetical protein
MANALTHACQPPTSLPSTPAIVFAQLGTGPSPDESFYLKFVKRNGLLKNGSILKPLAHFKQIVGSPSSSGARGGVRISYEQLDGSYMRHSTFIDLFQAGYIGAYAENTAAFKTLIEQIVAGNRSAVAAIQYPSSAAKDQSYIPPSRYRRPQQVPARRQSRCYRLSRAHRIISLSRALPI